MKSKPVVLNLFCCQGGSAKGYADAGFEVYGVDLAPQPKYQYPFLQSDAIQFVVDHMGWIKRSVALIDASPPCQLYSKTHKINSRDWPDLIGPTRTALQSTGVPFVIENVEDARPELVDPTMLCGAMFGLRTYRHRLFETGGWSFEAPEHPEHTARTTKLGRARKPGEFAHYVGNFSGVDEARRDMGMDWATRDGIREAVPPAYTQYIGKQFLVSA